MKNKFWLRTSRAVTLGLSLWISTQGQAQSGGPKTRSEAQKQCYAENKIDPKAGQKLTCPQLLAMDACMRSKGIQVGKRVSCPSK